MPKLINVTRKEVMTKQFTPRLSFSMLAWLALASQTGFAVDMPPTVLSIGCLTNRTIRLSSSGWRYAQYSIETKHDLTAPFWTVIASPSAGMDGTMAFIDRDATNYTVGFYRSTVRPPNPGSLLCALLVKRSIELSGNMIIDSFNSQDPNYSTAGQYDLGKSEEGGDIATICTNTAKAITGGGGAKVYGHIGTGSNDTVDLGNSSSGGNDWVNAGNPGVQPGWWVTNMSANIPDVTLPTLTWLTPVEGVYPYGGTNYSFRLDNGNYKVNSSFALSGKQNVLVTGNVVLYVPRDLNISGSAYIYLAPGSSLTCYMGRKGIIAGRGIVNGTSFAANCALYGLPSNISINLSGGSDFIGTIYAPEADLTLSGGGGSQQFVGAIVAQSANISGGYLFHYDESLRSR
jgi:hypothetical protein